MSRFVLPSAPPQQSSAVKAWREPVVIPTYLPLPPDKNPMFLEKRVYQGSSGRVYPLPMIDRIADAKTNHAWDAVHLENPFIRLMILPQIGGRIHIGFDKTNGYDFFYRQNVIKPALVGLAGPWISGGVEFNWPQHHRPSTFLPVETAIERHEDGSVTVWCSEHDPMNRMKGMHGVCLHPNRAIIELKVRLYNRTTTTQSFLWWANVAARVHEKYQSFFPPDVDWVADHAKRATSRYPLCDGFYYGVNYGARGREGVSPDQRPARFIPRGDYAANDLSWYANIPVPTSYMCMGTREDFFGGYDHSRQAGLVHVASHHISPGKKQWTWGNHDFGYAWDRNLTDEDGPYIELMAGVFTDNQPDFSFLHPGETRTFSQFWYPIQQIGPAQKANTEAAVSLTTDHGRARIGVATTAGLEALVVLEHHGRVLKQWNDRIAPGRPLVEQVDLPRAARITDLRLVVRDVDGRTVIEYAPAPRRERELAAPASEPAMPGDVSSCDELYLIGLHLEQYRHATRLPELYWREALRRDPSDARCNNAMGLWHMRRGEFEQAESHFRRAIESLTRRNPNPLDGEPYYNLGLALRYRHDSDESGPADAGDDLLEQACDAFHKSAWNYAWQSAAYYAIAEIDCRRRDWRRALEHLDRSLRTNQDHLKARNLRAIVLRKLGQTRLADEAIAQTLAMDPLDAWARHLSGQSPTCDTQHRMDVALDFAGAGLINEAIGVLLVPAAAGPGDEKARSGRAVRDDNSAWTPDQAAPLLHYYLAHFHHKSGNAASAHRHLALAAEHAPDYGFPARLEEIAILRSAIALNPRDPRAPYFLGNLLYDRRRHEEAIALWERSAKLDPSFSIVWRNLGIAYFNIRKNPAKARSAYEKALAAAPDDSRILYERDQLWKRMGIAPKRRLAELEQHRELVERRDDLSIELCALYNLAGRHEQALSILESRRFQPWEGGEGLVLGQHVRAHLALGRKSLEAGDPEAALSHFTIALAPPENLGEARHLLANASDIHYWLGEALAAAGKAEDATKHWGIAASFRGDFQEMSVRRFSEMTYWSALSLRRLGKKKDADRLLKDLLAHARALRKSPAKIDYFATSLPTMLLFEDDLQKRQSMAADVMEAQAQFGLSNRRRASALLRAISKADPSLPVDFIERPRP